MLTISHQYGSGGSLIARDLGGRLRWSVWDKEIVHKIATEYQLAETDVEAKDERAASFIERLVGWRGPQRRQRRPPSARVRPGESALRRPGHAQVTPWSRPGRAQVRSMTTPTVPGCALTPCHTPPSGRRQGPGRDNRPRPAFPS